MFPIQRIMIVASLACFASVRATGTQTIDVQGKKYTIEQQQVKTKNLGALLKNAGIKKRAAPTCPPPPPINPPGTFTEPAQNPNAPAVAFVPNNAVSNSAQPPPQTVGAQTFISIANNPSQLLPAPFNIGSAIGTEQALFISSLSFDKL